MILKPVTSRHQGTKRTPFSKQCVEIMDFFLEHHALFFTPKTAALSLDKPIATVKDCMNLLKRNCYLSKVSETGSVYHLTKMNIELWVSDFKKHILMLAEIKQNRRDDLDI